MKHVEKPVEYNSL